MKTEKTKSTVTAIAILVFAFQLFFVPASSQAKYVDRSGELPGMNSSPFSSGLVIAVGALLVGAVTLKLMQKSKKDDDQIKVTPQKETGKDTEAEEDDEFLGYDEGRSGAKFIADGIFDKGSKPSLTLFLNVDQSESSQIKSNTLDFSDLTVKAGVTFGF